MPWNLGDSPYLPVFVRINIPNAYACEEIANTFNTLILFLHKRCDFSISFRSSGSKASSKSPTRVWVPCRIVRYLLVVSVTDWMWRWIISCPTCCSWWSLQIPWNWQLFFPIAWLSKPAVRKRLQSHQHQHSIWYHIQCISKAMRTEII